MNLLFPPLCFNCQQVLLDNEKIICKKCYLKMLPLSKQILLKKDKGEYLDELFGLWIFDDNFKNIIHFLKYSNCQNIGIEIGKMMGEYLIQNEIDLNNVTLVPIPLHEIKLRERGYNQSELIAKGISKVTGVKINTKLVKRIKNTSTQTKMNRNERVENMKDAFIIKNEVEESVIFLIDDVYTTGTTMNSVAKVIKENKDVKIVAYCAAMPES